MEQTRDVAKEIIQSYGVNLSIEGLNGFAKILKPIKLLRHQSPFEQGQVCEEMYYVKRGLVLQHYKKNGVDVVEHISHEGDMVICIESLFNQTPSLIKVTMLEPSLLYAIPREELLEMSKTSYEYAKFYNAILERSLIVSQKKADMLRFETAKQRYVRTLKENPEIVRRSPLHYVASLLQMKPETLSRVRTQVMAEGLNL